VDALADGGLRQADEDRLRQPGGHVDLHLDGGGDADQAKVFNLASIGGPLRVAEDTPPFYPTAPPAARAASRLAGS
jgi:hypothetical protein